MKNVIFIISLVFSINTYSQIYVNQNATGNNNGTSWQNAFTNLQNALAIANFGEEIWIAQGTYIPDSGTQNRVYTFSPPAGVKLLGGFNATETASNQRDWNMNPTILSGDIGVQGDSSDNSFSVVSTLNNNIILNGLIIEKGNASIDDPSDVSKRTGAGIYNNGDSNLLINCIIRNNTAQTSVNSGVGAGMISFFGELFLVNTLFYNNIADGLGGAFSGEAGTPTFINCTFAKNNAPNGSVLNVFLANVNVHNSIFASNVGLPINVYASGSGTLALTHSLLDTDFPVNVTDVGNNIVNANPLFVDIQNDDFSLLVNSPAVDVGNSNNPEPLDLANKTRVLDSDNNGTATIDLGAYETTYQAQTFVPDDNFEQALIDLGLDSGSLNDYVPTVNINSITSLGLSNKAISDLTGIQDFLALQILDVSSNTISTINLTSLSNLLNLNISNNSIASIDLSNNINLITLDVSSNNLTVLNINNNVNLTNLNCSQNQLTTLALNLNNSLIELNTSNNSLTALNVKNGNNSNFLNFNSINNPALGCINVDDVSYSQSNWTNIDSQSFFNIDCQNYYTGVTRLYVNINNTNNSSGDSWSSAFVSLQTALDIAASNPSIKEVWLAAGTYYPSAYPRNCIGCNDSRDYTFHLVDGVSLFGGFNGTESDINQRNIGQNETILSGNLLPNSSIHTVIVLDIANSILDGVSIANGGASDISSYLISAITINTKSISRNTGAGLVIANSTIDFINSNIRGNGFSVFAEEFDVGAYSGFASGAGMTVTDSNITLTNTSISNNSIFITANISPGMTLDSYSVGAAIYAENSTIKIINSKIFNNNAGTDNGAGGTPGISAHNPGISANGVLELTNVIFSGNNGNSSLIELFSGSLKFNNVTIANNQIGEVLVNGDIAEMNNTIIYNNTTNNDIVVNTLFGTNNFTQQDPSQYGSSSGFVQILSDPYINSADPDGADNSYGTADDGLYPAIGSILIGAGDNTKNLETTDITGNPRIYGSTIDVGVYESQTCLNSTQLTTSGWTNGAPSDKDTQAVFSDNYNTSTGNITACECEIETGKTLTVNAGGYLDIQGNITVNGNLIIEHEGSVVQGSDVAKVANNGSIQVLKIMTSFDAGTDFAILGSPMTAETRDGVYNQNNLIRNHITANFIPNPDVELQDPTANNFADDNGDNWQPFTSSETIVPGTGYLVGGITGGGTFTSIYNQGTLNNGLIEFNSIYNGSQNASPNILSNPYASAIDAAVFINDNDIVDAIYFWEHLTPPNSGYPGYRSENWDMGDISIYNLSGGIAASNGGNAPSQFVPSGQGFGIKANAIGTVSFNNSMRVTSPNTGYRNSENIERLYLQLKNETYNLTSSTLIAFSTEATDQLEKNYDAKRLATPVSIFSVVEETELAIQGRSAFNIDQVISIGIRTQVEEQQEYSISLGDITGTELLNTRVYLLDRLLDIETNLSETNYTFIANEGNFSNRFLLYFREGTILETSDVALNSIKIYPVPSSDSVTIFNAKSLELFRATIYDMIGRKIKEIDLSDSNSNKNIDISNLNTGNYIIKIEGNSGVISKKIIKK